jgi:hypothetical protein
MHRASKIYFYVRGGRARHRWKGEKGGGSAVRISKLGCGAPSLVRLRAGAARNLWPIIIVALQAGAGDEVQKLLQLAIKLQPRIAACFLVRATATSGRAVVAERPLACSSRRRRSAVMIMSLSHLNDRLTCAAQATASFQPWKKTWKKDILWEAGR